MALSYPNDHRRRCVCDMGLLTAAESRKLGARLHRRKAGNISAAEIDATAAVVAHPLDKSHHGQRAERHQRDG